MRKRKRREDDDQRRAKQTNTELTGKKSNVVGYKRMRGIFKRGDDNGLSSTKLHRPGRKWET